MIFYKSYDILFEKKRVIKINSGKTEGKLNKGVSNVRVLHNVECYEHMHFNVEICIVTKGRLMVTRESEKFFLDEGMCIFIMPYEIHSYKSIGNNQTIIIEVSTLLFDELRDRIGFAASAFNIKKSTLEYVKNKPEYKRDSEIFWKSLVYPIINDFFDECSMTEVSALHSRIYLAAIEYIAQNYKEDINLKTAAESIGYSYVYLSRIFSKNVGISFTAYLNRYRVMQSLKMLKEGNMLVTEIAYSCGFGNLRSYNREFKKCLNMTPKEYRIYGNVYYFER